MKRVGTVLGAMEFGRGPCVGSIPGAMVEAFLNFDETFRHVDTAYMYTGGESEKLMGQMGRLKESIPLNIQYSTGTGTCLACQGDVR